MGFIVVRASGTPYQRGQAIGRALGSEIHASLAFVGRYLDRHGIDPSALDRLLAPYVHASEAAVPHLVEQLRGIADGAEQPFAHVMAANAFEELYGQIELGIGARPRSSDAPTWSSTASMGRCSATPSSGTPATTGRSAS